ALCQTDKSTQLSLVFVGAVVEHYYTLLYPGQRHEVGLNLSQLYAITKELNLIIGPSQEEEITLGVDANQMASAVKVVVELGIAGILARYYWRTLRIADIALGHRDTPPAHFALRFYDCRHLTGFHAHKDFQVPARLTVRSAQEVEAGALAN